MICVLKNEEIIGLKEKEEFFSSEVLRLEGNKHQQEDAMVTLQEVHIYIYMYIYIYIYIHDIKMTLLTRLMCMYVCMYV